MQYREIQKAHFNSDFSINIEFVDGTNGIVKIQESRFRKIFTPLRDVKLFLKEFVKYGAITWNVGDYELDLTPDIK